MNAVATMPPNDDEIIRVLQNSLYPGAKPESILLVLSYCRVNGIDPLLKPVHIVPTSVKVSSKPDKWEYRDVLMPGIADYRIKAARSGEYGGKTEPEFGPDRTLRVNGIDTKYPEWCRITVSRIVKGAAREFTAKEFWLENYAAAGRDTELPNTMWRKRSYGQLAKCTEAQALRMAFPEFSGGQPTAEEMEGKETFTGTTIEAEPPRSPTTAREQINAEVPIAPPVSPPKKRTAGEWLTQFDEDCAKATTEADANAVLDGARAMEDFLKQRPAAYARYETIKAGMLARIFDVPPDVFPHPDADEIGARLADPLEEVAQMAEKDAP